MRFRGSYLFFVVGASLLTGCSTAPDYFPPPEAEGGWRKNTTPEFVHSLGIDPERLEEFGSYNLAVQNSSWHPYANHKGIIVIKDGWIVGEWYNSPAAQQFKTYLSSNGKSFVMFAFGIVVQDGRDGRIEYSLDPGSALYDRRWLPEGFPLSDDRKTAIVFEQIFRHTSGLCPERTAQGEDVEKGRNKWTDYVEWVVGHDEKWLETSPLYFDPGRAQEYSGKEISGEHAFGYSSVGFCHLGLVFRNLYRKPASQFIWKRLLKPIGFSGIDYHAPPGETTKWFSAGGLRMTPRDYARFAYLLLNDGRWAETEIVPSDWVQRFRNSSAYPNLRSNMDGIFGKQCPNDMFRIAGSGLNWAFIVPSMDLIALRTGRANNTEWEEVEREFLNRLFASLRPQ